MARATSTESRPKRILYLDCASGISGDMTVAALLDLGADRAELDRALASLPLGGYEVAVTRVAKAGVSACDFDVRLGEGLENHDHDMEWLYGHQHQHQHEHAHEHEHEHGEHHHHEHRTLADVLAVVDAGSLTPGARERARRIFETLADAEAAAHGTTRDLVHFHEVGAVDSIVDVVAAAVCLDSLGADEVAVSPLAEGTGTVRCAHGIMPVPVPAVVAIAARHGLAFRPTQVQGELVTPTGAAIAAASRTIRRLPASVRVAGVGYGAGKRAYEDCSGLLRAMLLEDAGEEAQGAAEQAAPAAGPGADRVVKLECDIDDCPGEALGRLVGQLLAAGAREAHYLPVFTKKNRPAWQLQVICAPAEREALEALVFSETTTIGIRRSLMERTVLPRAARAVRTEYGEMRCKEVRLPDGARRLYPEHESVEEAARASGVGYQDAWRACLAACVEAQGAPSEEAPEADGSRA